MSKRVSEIKPITFDEFDLVMSKINFFEKIPFFGISYSGGVDSLALLFLLKKWVDKREGKLKSFIVDHGLKKTSLNESLFAKKNSEKLGVTAKILKWEGIKPTSRIMETARKKRYEMITNECAKEKITNLFIGHHLNDQLETYQMRLLRNPSAIGLSSMSLSSQLKEVRIIRPLINFEKKRLIDTCKSNNLTWNNDPLNNDFKYERVQIRKNLINVSKKKKIIMKKKIEYFQLLKEKYEICISNFFIRNVTFYPWGVFEIDKKKLFKEEKKNQIEFFRKILTTSSGKIYSPQYKSVYKLIENLKKNIKKTQTLHSCIIEHKDEKILILREIIKTKKNYTDKIIINPKESFLWDYRFQVSSMKHQIELKIIDLNSWKFIKDYFFKKENRELKFRILQSLPLIKNKNKFFIPFINNPQDLRELGIDFFFNPINSLTINK